MSRQEPHDVHRPMYLSEIIGNGSVVKRTRLRLSTCSGPSRWFFSGPVGSGKTTMACITGRMLLCSQRQPEDSEPCGECLGCVSGCYTEYICSKLNDLAHFERCSLPGLAPLVPVVVAFEDLECLRPDLQQRLRRAVEECVCTLVFTTTSPKALDNTLYNRLRSYEYAMKRPQPDYIANHLQREFELLELTFDSRSQLIRIAEEYHCELRPCCEFPRKVSAETNGHLTDEYLDEIFPAASTWR